MKLTSSILVLLAGLSACSNPNPDIDRRLAEEDKNLVAQENKLKEAERQADIQSKQRLTELAKKLRDTNQLPSERVTIGEQIVQEFPDNPHIPSVRTYIKELQSQGDWHYQTQEDELRSTKTYTAFLANEQPKEREQGFNMPKPTALLTLRKKFSPSGEEAEIVLHVNGDTISCYFKDCPVEIQLDNEAPVLTQGGKYYDDKSVEILVDFMDRIQNSSKLRLRYSNYSGTQAFHFKTRGFQHEKLTPK